MEPDKQIPSSALHLLFFLFTDLEVSCHFGRQDDRGCIPLIVLVTLLLIEDRRVRGCEGRGVSLGRLILREVEIVIWREFPGIKLLPIAL